MNLFVYAKLVANRQRVNQTLLLKASTVKKDLSGSCLFFIMYVKHFARDMQSSIL